MTNETETGQVDYFLCAACGTTNKIQAVPDSRLCPGCGTDLYTAHGTVITNQPPVAALPTSSNLGSPAIILISMTILFVVGIAIVRERIQRNRQRSSNQPVDRTR